MVWFGMVWYGMVWCGVVWYGLLTLAGIGMLTYSFLRMLLLCWGTGICAVATDEQLSLSDTWRVEVNMGEWRSIG